MSDEFEGDSADVDEPGFGPEPDVDETPAFLTWVAEQLGRVEAFGIKNKENVPWCSEWWEHPEVVERLYVAYRAYVGALSLSQAEPASVSSWWINHWDRHAAVIFDPLYGPFRRCDRDGHLIKADSGPLIDLVQPPDDWAV